MKKRRTRWILPCTFALALTACASGQRSTGTSPGPEGRELERLEALFQARADSVTSNVSEADVEFMTGMISHHAQALVMSGLAPTHGASPQMRILTSRIINAHTDGCATASDTSRKSRSTG